MTHREAFLKALEENRYCEATHRVFADWLEENDEPELADFHRKWTAEWQRKYDAAETWLKWFAESVGSEVNEIVAAGKMYAEMGQESQVGSDFLGMDATNLWCDDGVPEAFWEHYQSYTGTVVEESKRGEPFECCV